VIKDSGTRSEFDTGAVRDMQKGKGRCDLMPLEVVAGMLEVPSYDMILSSIREFQHSGRTRYLYDTLMYFARSAYAGCKETMLLEVSIHFEEGAEKYGEWNWQRGLPTWCYLNSAVRHYLKWRRGDQDEPHDRAFVWNVLCCIWETDFRVKEEPAE
jgi:hypothetical protein